MNSSPSLIVCMGVSGSGKSTLGHLLADSFGLAFVDADDYHSEANKKRMAAGTPLTDRDREPWMRYLCKALSDFSARNESCVLAHSALKKQHREQLRHLGFRTIFLHFDGARELIARRIARRQGHFMHAGLLDSQFDALDATTDECDVVSIDISGDDTQVSDTMSRLVDNFLPTKVNA